MIASLPSLLLVHPYKSLLPLPPSLGFREGEADT